MSGRPCRKHSARPTSSASPPALSMALRAARILSTAVSSSYSGRDASPVESSIDNPATPMAVRPGKSGAGGGERLEAEPLQIARAADVPGVGNDEASGLVQSVKRAALVGNAGTNVRHVSSSGEIPIVHATENSRTSRLLAGSLARHGAIADIAAVLHQVPVNRVHERVRLASSGGNRIAQTHGAEHSAAGGDDLRAVGAGARMKYFPGHSRGRVEAADRIALD